MIGRIWAIALNTHREAIRQKVLYALVFFSALLILFALFLGQLSLGADTKIVKDLGLASILLFGVLMAVFLGIGLVFKEVERRTVYTILSKPVSRPEFVLGKFFGLAITIALEVAAMTLLLYATLSLYREPLDFALLKAILLIYMEILVLIAVALFFSSYSSSMMSALFCISFLIVGHAADDFSQLFLGKAEMMTLAPEASVRLAGRVLTFLISTFELFSLDHLAVNAEVVHGVPIPASWIGQGLLFGACWVVVWLAGAVALFNRKDLQ